MSTRKSPRLRSKKLNNKADNTINSDTSESSNTRTSHHFTMIREFTAADLITLGNSASGTSSLFASLKYVTTGNVMFLYAAIWLLPLALVFDIFDGRVARWRRTESIIGQELDSLADIVSFGLAPAVLGFAIGLQGLFDVVILLFFVNCGISRLARYNSTIQKNKSSTSGKVEFFEGTPIPTTVLIGMVILLLVLNGNFGDGRILFGKVFIFGWTLHPFTLIYFVSGCLQISRTIRIPKPT